MSTNRFLLPVDVEVPEGWDVSLVGGKRFILEPRAVSEADPRDTTRLEWLLIGTGHKKAARVMGSDDQGWAVCDCSNGLTFLCRDAPTWREAIDKAMEVAP